MTWIGEKLAGIPVTHAEWPGGSVLAEDSDGSRGETKDGRQSAAAGAMSASFG